MQEMRMIDMFDEDFSFDAILEDFEESRENVKHYFHGLGDYTLTETQYHGIKKALRIAHALTQEPSEYVIDGSCWRELRSRENAKREFIAMAKKLIKEASEE